jgi:catechol 2,3-dioxygenase-like lactoylglutathione lyase family enzyme
MAKITGAHAIIYSRNAEADRGFLRDILGFPFVDVGHGWLIFGVPPAEVAVHPADDDESHQLYLMVDDVHAFISSMAARGVACSAAQDLRWGLLTQVTLPSGGTLGVYQPRHARPTPQTRGRANRRRTIRKTKSAIPARRRTRR